ncbi:MAG: oxygenase MpaB family protein [Candidatus Nanopelagicales bacterium]
MINPLSIARERIASGFRRMVSGESDGAPEWVTQLSRGVDKGFFGPGSATWAVHGSLPTLVGGVRSLLMQALHPGALAGVDEHSRYEADPLGRLAGTTQWLTVVTFGDTEMAERECARVRGMHRKVTGSYINAHGQEKDYKATDSDLLRWVHVAFADSFLAAHLVWGGPIPGGPDQYVREWAIAGEMVGVTDPPRSFDELQDQLNAFRPDLCGGERALRTVRFVRNAPVPLAAKAPYSALFAGAAATMPKYQRELLGLPTIPMTAVKPVVTAMLGSLGWVLGPTSPSMNAANERVATCQETPGSP